MYVLGLAFGFGLVT